MPVNCAHPLSQSGFRIADFKVEPELNKLAPISGPPDVRIEPRVMKLLVFLAEHGGQALTKERIISAVWDGAFVSDDVLKQAVSALRKALGDDPKSPRFIETIPRRGYRLIAPVTRQLDSRPLRGRAAPETERTRPKLRLGSVLAVLGALALGSWHFDLMTAPRPDSLPLQIRPLTSLPGHEGHPAFSPDGSRIAFDWEGDGSRGQGIYVKLIDDEKLLRLTDDEAVDCCPIWSPDGTRLAFVRLLPEQAAIYEVSALGGAERRLFPTSDSSGDSREGDAAVRSEMDTPSGAFARQRLRLGDWSPDGRSLSFAWMGSRRHPPGIYLLSTADLSLRQASTSPPQSFDLFPRFLGGSSKGSFVASRLSLDSYSSDLHIRSMHDGAIRPLITDQPAICGLDVSADGSEIVFSSSSSAGKRDPGLWILRLPEGEPQRILPAASNLRWPTLSPDGRLLAYSHHYDDTNIWAVRLDRPQRRTRIVASTRLDTGPALAPDGERIAFESNRSGTAEIWISDRDGGNAAQLTRFGGPHTGTPRWSPAGDLIAFDSRPRGRADIFLISPDGKRPRRLTDDQSDDVVPSWSRDGRWVYFASNRSGRYEVWKKPAAGGNPVQLTRQGGFAAFEGPEGKHLYFTRNGLSGLWRMPLAGGEAERFSHLPQPGYWGYWSVSSQGIFVLDASIESRPSIEFVPFSGTEVRTVAVLRKKVPIAYPGMTISADGNLLLFNRVDVAQSDILVAENFR